jgi:hypothetical protein
LEYVWGGLYKRGILVVVEEEEALVFGFGVHALVGGDSVAFEDGFL